MKYYIKKVSQLIFSNIEQHESCHELCTTLNHSKIVDCKKYNEKRRCGIYNKSGFEIYICSKDTIQSKRLFSNSIDVVINFASEIDKSKDQIQKDTLKQVERLIHNLKTYNAHCIQLADILIDPSSNKKSAVEQIAYIESFLQQTSEKAAKSIIKIIKNNKLIQAEISIYDSLFKSDTSNLRIANHQIHKLIRGILIVFFEEFQEKNVVINLQNTNEEVAVDYQTFICSIIHLFENAVKYVCPDSTIEISFSTIGSKVNIEIEMTSLCILEKEKDEILNEGTSGFYAKKLGLSGKGIGMAVITRFLQLSGGQLIVKPKINHKLRVTKYGIPYERNLFTVEVPKSGGLYKMI